MAAMVGSSARFEQGRTKRIRKVNGLNHVRQGEDSSSFNDILAIGIQQQARQEIFNARKSSKKKKLSVRSKLRHRERHFLVSASQASSEVAIYPTIVATSDNMDRMADHLLDPNVFPVGFSLSKSPTSDSWFAKVEHALNQTTPQCVVKAFSLMDRWLQEERTNSLDGTPRFIAVESVDCVIRCWSASCLTKNVEPDVASPEEVWTRVAKFLVPNGNGLSLSMILETMGKLESKETAPYRGEKLLREHLNLSDSRSSSVGINCLNTATINTLMRMWRRSRLPESPASVDRLLSQLGDWHRLSQRTDQMPDDVTYATVLTTWMSMATPGAAVHRADVLMSEIQHQPTFVIYSTIVDVLAKAGHVERAHKLLHAFVKAQGRASHTETIERFEDCNPILSILEAYRKRVDRQPMVATAQMERFIAQMETVSRKSSVLRAIFHPDEACYNVLIDVYNQLRSPYRSEGLLRHVLRLHDDGNGGIFRHSLTPLWNGVLESWAHSGDAETVPRTTALIKFMETKSKLDRLSQPNPRTYTLFLLCVANDRRNVPAENARLAYELLLRMEREEDGLCKPIGESYDVVLLAWCKAGYPDQADLLLHRLCSKKSLPDEPKESGFSAIYPTSLQFVTVLYGWAKIARRRNWQHRVLERVESLLQTMHAMFALGYPTKPSLTAYNIFLECLVKSHEIDAPERAESFLRLLEKNNECDETLLPDAVVFNSILTAWLRSNRSDAPTKASALFNQMRSLHTIRGNIVNSFTYTTLMGIFAQHTLPEKVQEMFDEMQHTKALGGKAPFLAYTTLINAWAVAGKPEIAHATVEQLYYEFKRRDLHGPSKGATLAFNAVLIAWALSKNPDAATKAEHCLETMHCLATSGKFDIRLNLISYSSVIKALARSGYPNAGQRALGIFNRMRTSYMETGDHSVCPDLDVYVDLTEAIANSKQQTDLEVSVSNSECILRLFEEIDSLVHPSCWMDQGKLVLSRVAWHVAESGFDSSEKAMLLRQLQRLAKQHAVKLDCTIEMLFRQYCLTNKEVGYESG